MEEATPAGARDDRENEELMPLFGPGQQSSELVR